MNNIFFHFSKCFYLCCHHDFSYFCTLYFRPLKTTIFRTISLLFVLTAILTSCSLEKFVPKNSYVLDKMSIQIKNQSTYPQLDPVDITPYLQPKISTHFLFNRLGYWAHYKNQQHPGKINHLINKNLGNEVIYYSVDDVLRNTQKIKKYLNDLGFFNSKVNYHTIKKGKFIHLNFEITVSQPYRYNQINFHFPDSTIGRIIKKGLAKSLLKKGDIYNAYTLDDERDRITSELRNRGYYYFNRNYIQYLVDTNNLKHHIHLQVDIKNRELADIQHPGRMIQKPHKRYFLHQVYVIPDFNPLRNSKLDTIDHPIFLRGVPKAYHFKYLTRKPPRFNLSTFDHAFRLGPERAYSDLEVQQTYQKLFNYPVLRSVDISFDSLPQNDNTNKTKAYLNAYIRMQTGKLNTISLESMGTNSSGDLGVNGLISFTNRNIFRRAEVLRMRLMGGFEAQNLGVLSADSITVAPINSSGLFNTFEAGIDATVFFPMSLFPFRNIDLPGNPQTNVGIGFNYQRRPYYSRNITNAEWGYSWNQTHTIKHEFTPLNINFVSVNPSPYFQDILNNETNQRLKEQYSNHMIVGLKYSFIFNNQQTNHTGNFNFLRLNFESSGNLLNAINKIAGSQRTNEGFYNILGVRYSQYARLSSDFRHYIQFDKEGTALVYRLLLGLAIPYGNSNDIPYEKGFYAGGANGMRGWRFRTLGPGAFAGQDTYERLGEIQLEGNLEFRFPVYQFIKAAFFIDAGNIWNYRANNTYPLGNFQWKRFANEIAIDAGTGIRFDFSYFIFRLDAAVPLRDPALSEGKRWAIQDLTWKNVVANFGIGYPF
jgi:outer membrane protein assembly factor BamA